VAGLWASLSFTYIILEVFETDSIMKPVFWSEKVSKTALQKRRKLGRLKDKNFFCYKKRPSLYGFWFVTSLLKKRPRAASGRRAARPRQRSGCHQHAQGAKFCILIN
jgi:hypothetical protein